MEIFRSILSFLNEKGIKLDNKKVLLSFSGGPDSTLLFYFLLFCRKNLNTYFECFYLNHNERDDVKNEEYFVENICRKNGIFLNYKNVEILSSKERKSLGFERAGRELRKKFLENIFIEKKFDYIFTGHNFTDSVETFFINLQRNMGLRGATPMKSVDKSYVRPLLFLKKNEIIDILKKEKIEYIEDKTNFDRRIVRNKIRHELIPSLESSLKDGILSFKTFFENISELEEGFDQIIFENLKIFEYDESSPYILIDIPKVLSYNKKLRKILIYFALSKFFYVNKNLIDEVQKVLVSKKKNVEKKCGDFFIVKSYDKLLISKNFENFEREKFLEVEINKRVLFNCFEFEIKKVENGKGFYFEDSKFYFSVESGKRFFLKTFEKGDRMTIFKMVGSKRLSKIFIDLKIEKSLRDKMPVLVNEKGEILLLGNLKRSDLYPVDFKNDKEFFEVYVKRVC
uniref:tRNA(Ile)-lysidine synthase n=1 Tax=candidate division WOR-3 bacterium TaxID=2052148 RepID=A0A7C3N966_UNCW3